MDPVKQIPAVKIEPAIKEMKAVEEKVLVYVKAINAKILEQLWATRGELDSTPYTDLGPEWRPVGIIAKTGDVLLRNACNEEIRLCWFERYCLTKQNIQDRKLFELFRKNVAASLPTIYVA